ncbi:hypothetical protein BASA83_013203 [Batrachochytrium salamandrivorans]|nr:hypothetical protein BASA83_013203 [Batrachochytrium salamandrivorans]
MVDFGSSYCLENCCVGLARIQGLGKPPRTSDISPKPSIPEKQESSGQTSDSAVDSDSRLQVYSKTLYGSRSRGPNDQYLEFPKALLNRFHSPKLFKQKLPVLGRHHRFQKLPIPPGYQ